MYAVGGTMGNVHILENCQIDGRLSAAQIDGDIAKTYVLYQNSVYIPPQMFDMNLVALGDGRPVRFNGVDQTPIQSIKIAEGGIIGTTSSGGGSPGHGAAPGVHDVYALDTYIDVYRLEKGRAITLSAWEIHTTNPLNGKPYDKYSSVVVWMSKA
ncbi:TPA: hypothetical protein ACJF1X_003014 [Salmonella enterica subsp. enterica serovar Muenchen]